MVVQFVIPILIVCARKFVDAAPPVSASRMCDGDRVHPLVQVDAYQYPIATKVVQVLRLQRRGSITLKPFQLDPIKSGPTQPPKCCCKSSASPCRLQAPSPPRSLPSCCATPQQLGRRRSTMGTPRHPSSHWQDDATRCAGPSVGSCSCPLQVFISSHPLPFFFFSLFQANNPRMARQGNPQQRPDQTQRRLARRHISPVPLHCRPNRATGARLPSPHLRVCMDDMAQPGHTPFLPTPAPDRD